MFEVVKPKKQVPYEQRREKTLSVRSQSKIKTKIENWYDVKLAQVGFNPDKLGFHFITFTVTIPNFSHEKTVLAWRNFMSNYKEKMQKQGKSFNYLWVAEKQTGETYLKKAEWHLKKFNEKGVHADWHYQQYLENSEKGQNPTNNIHYHMLVDRMHNINDLNKTWLAALENKGAPRYNEHGVEYKPVQLPKKQPCRKCDKCKSGMSASCNNKYRPKLNTLKIRAYLAKYMTKDKTGLKCLLWHCTSKISHTATSLTNCDLREAPLLDYIDQQKERYLTLC